MVTIRSARLLPPAKPRFTSDGTIRTHGYRSASSVLDESMDALSTTHVSKVKSLTCLAIASRQAGSRCAPFQLTITTVASGAGPPSWVLMGGFPFHNRS